MRVLQNLCSLRVSSVVLGMSLFLLAGCGGGPSNRDVVASLMTAYPGTRPTDGIKTEEVIKADNGDYVVKLSNDTKGGAGMLGDPAGHYTLRVAMTKIDGRWRIIRSELLGADPLR